MSKSIYRQLRRRFGPAPDPVTRRELLAMSLATGFALLVSGCTSTGARKGAKDNGRSVVIVGAGFAGLACAYKLRALGYKVTVLDARPRVGGRVLSSDSFVPGKSVDIGGEYVGRNHPAWLALAEELGVKLREDPDEDGSEPMIFNGRQLPSDEAERVYEEMDAGFAKMNALAETIDADRPWTSPRAAELDARSVADWIRTESGASPEVQRAMATVFTADNGMAAERQSLLGLLAVVKGHGVQSYWEETEVFHCEGGTQALAKRLADEVGYESLRLGVPVASVAATGDGASVTTRNGDVLRADRVIVTVPPNAYRNLRFDPVLPADYFPTQGSVVKFLSRMRRPFWRDLDLASTSLTDGPVSMTWDGTCGQDGMLAGKEVCLSAFSGGPAAEECSRNAGNAKAFYGPLMEALYPGYGNEVIRSQFIDWPADPWSGGGYSFAEPGQVMSRGPHLTEPFAEHIHFAGEHTCLPFIGFMEGGLQSGVRLANRLAVADGLAGG